MKSGRKKWRRFLSSRCKAKAVTSCRRRSICRCFRSFAASTASLLVADEIQSGFGRTGKMFACEHWGIEPDILCAAKGIASGMPLGAMIARAEISTWTDSTHGSTFGGNPVACAAALATIELLEEGLVENAATVGPILKEQTHRAQIPSRSDWRCARPRPDDRRRLRRQAAASPMANFAIASCKNALRKACCC